MQSFDDASLFNGPSESAGISRVPGLRIGHPLSNPDSDFVHSPLNLNSRSQSELHNEAVRYKPQVKPRCTSVAAQSNPVLHLGTDPNARFSNLLIQPSNMYSSTKASAKNNSPLSDQRSNPKFKKVQFLKSLYHTEKKGWVRSNIQFDK